MTDKEKQKTWERFINTKSHEDREKLILEYAPLVKIVAGRMYMYLSSLVEYDDIISYGIFGLIDAIDKFSLSKGVKFETYASLRIRGEILDNIRKMDWIPRTLRRKQREISEVTSKLRSKYNREPSDDEVADELGISADEYDKLLVELNGISLVYYDDEANNLDTGSIINTVEQSAFITPEDSVAKAEFKEKITEAIDLLTEKEKQVIMLFYYEELTIKEIANVLEVTESRISQLHSKAINKMRVKLDKYLGILYNV